MKLHADAHSALNTVTAYGPGFIEVNRQAHRGALILLPEGPVLNWPIDSFDQIEEQTLSALLEHQPEIVLLGTGPGQRFPSARVQASLSAARIGLDVMSTPAACRTFNILVAEGRRVLAALLPG